jgi:ankyrin repeat protein
MAIENGHEAIVKLLLAKGGDIDPKASLEISRALLLVAKNGHESVVDLLLKKGAN